jgi:hypothetical protein
MAMGDPPDAVISDPPGRRHSQNATPAWRGKEI